MLSHVPLAEWGNNSRSVNMVSKKLRKAKGRLTRRALVASCQKAGQIDPSAGNCSVLSDHPTGLYSLEISIEDNDQNKLDAIVQKLHELNIEHTVVFDD